MSTILGMALLAAGSQHSVVADVQFTDVTEAAGLADDSYVTFTNHGLGVDWIDYDNDGWPDLFAVNGYTEPPHLYHNDHDGTFTKVDELLPALPCSGEPEEFCLELTGAVFADYDNDGDMDIYVQVSDQSMFLWNDNVGDGPPNMLYKNLWVENGGQIQPGKPLFVDVAAAAGVDGVLDKPLGKYPASSSLTGGWLDYDRDGWVDLYVGSMVWNSGGAVSNVDTLYRNNRDGTFTDVTVESNVNPGTDPERYRPALAFLGADLNHDMWPDMYVVNAHDPSPFHHDLIFINNQDGTFTDVTPTMPGIGDDSGSGMGIDFADVDLDGNWDIYISDILDTQNDSLPFGNVLYFGNSDGTWQDNTAPEAGVAADFSWGVNFLDVDHDGYEDLFVVTFSGREKLLYINNHDRTFTLLTPEDAGIETTRSGRGSAVADYDRDGDLDIIMVTASDEGLYLFRNDTTGAGHFLELNLVAVDSNRAAIGALVQVQAGDLSLMRQILGGSSAHSQDELLVHFGLADATVVDEVRITWPSGIEDVFHDVSADQLLTVVEGETTVPSEFTELARYTFDDGSAGDATGNGHDGTIFGDPSSVVGISGQALRFDGQDDWISVSHSPAFDMSDISLDVWVRVDATPTSDAVILRKMAGDIGYSLGIQGSTGAVEFTVQQSLASAGTVVAPFPLFPNVWTSIYAVYDGTELRLSLDGLPVASMSAPGLGIGNAAEVTIAAAGAGRDGADRFFVGVLDEITLGAGAKTASAICQDALKLWDSPSQTCIESVTDVTEALRVGDTEHVHSAVCMVDINDDGWIDLYYGNGLVSPEFDTLPQSGTCPDLADPPPVIPENVNVCYLNQGDGTFTADIAPEAGLDDVWSAMRQVWGDYDNDGRRDLLSHNFLVSPLYHAVSGPEPLLFEDASESSSLIVCLRKGVGAAWADINNDGWLDLYAGEYRGPTFPPENHIQLMFLNNGDGTFTDITAEAGMDLPANPRGIAFGDYDNDGDQDVYLANSDMPSILYRNDGVDQITGIPQFTDVAQEAGVVADDTDNMGMGAAWGDYDNDRRLDLLFTRDPGGTRLWHNDGPDADGVWEFSDVTDSLGVDFSELSYHDGNFADLDNDGWLDIVLTNASLSDPIPTQPSLVFLNNRDGEWREVAATLGMDLPEFALRGFVAGDIDNDGDVDLILLARDEAGGVPNFLFRNDARGNNWIQFRLTGSKSNRDAVGTRINVQATNQPGQPDVWQIREVVAGTGFLSDVPRIQTFGLGKATVVPCAAIQWPNGRLQVLGPLAINQRYDVLEPRSGDSDGDGDLDLRDFVLFQSCYTGPCAPSCDPPLSLDCRIVDFDFDEDVDAEDLTAFVTELTGPQ